jgi:hypothetical protein
VFPFPVLRRRPLHDREDFYVLYRIKVYAIMKTRPGEHGATGHSELTASGESATPQILYLAAQKLFEPHSELHS